MTVLVFGGMFGAFMYIEPLLTRVTGFSEGVVPWLLVLFGVGLFFGNLLGGRWADRALTRTLLALTLALGLSLAAFALLRPPACRCGCSTMPVPHRLSPRRPISRPSTWATSSACGCPGWRSVPGWAGSRRCGSGWGSR
ncbi:hypothetical protein ACFYO7_27370 [Nocardia salmonicida]|uniref:hypothetical protein n=1 Tax=Nocardia salmonicida TaxID=53431 RepID=UPI0036CE2524